MDDPFAQFDDWAKPAVSKDPFAEFDDWAKPAAKEPFSPNAYNLNNPLGEASRAALPQDRRNPLQSPELAPLRSQEGSGAGLKGLSNKEIDAAAHEWAWNQRAQEPELAGVGVRDVLETMIPGGSSVWNFKEKQQYIEAKRVQERDPYTLTDEQRGVIAKFELGEERKAKMSFGRKLGQAAMSLPAIVGEAYMAGPVAEGVAGVAGGGIVGTAAGKLAQGAVLPSLVAPAAQQRAQEQGGSFASPENFAPAVGISAVKNLILGTVGGQVGKVNANLPTRTIAAAALGITENQVSDAALTQLDRFLPEAYKTKLNNGTLGHALKGEQGEAWQALANDALAFGVFSLAHGRESKAPETLGKISEELTKAGVPEEKQPEIIRDALSKPPEETQKGPLRDFVEEMKATEAPKQPVEPAKPETAQPDPEPEIAAPAKPQEAAPAPEGVSLGQPEPGGKKFGGQELTRHTILDSEGKEIGDVKVFQSGGTLHVDWMGAKGAGATDKAAKGSLGAKAVTQTFEQLAMQYPDAVVMKYTPAEGRLNVGKDKYIDLDKVRQRMIDKQPALKEEQNAARDALGSGQPAGAVAEAIRSGEAAGLAAREGVVPPAEGRPPAGSVDPARPETGNPEATRPPVPGTEGGTPGEVTGLKKEFDATERERLNLPPGPEADPVGHSFPELRQQVLDITQKNPEAPRRLADELIQKPRNVSDVEAALLLKRAVELNNSHKQANADLEAARASGDPARIAEAQIAEAKALDEYHAVRNAAKETGAEQGRGLNAWKLMAKEDFTLARMLSDRKNRKGGKFDEKDREAVVEANKKIEELQSKVDALEARDKQARIEKENVKEFAKPLGVRTKAARAEVDAAWEELRSVTKGKLFSNPVDPEALIAAAKLTKAYIKLGVAKFSDLLAEVRARSNKPLTPEAEEILKQGWAQAHNDLANERIQKQTAKKTEEVKGKIAAGDFAKPEPKEPVKLNRDTMAAKAELARAQNEWREGNLRAEAADRPKYEKAMAIIAKWYRGSILSSPITLAKLTSAAIERTVFSPMQNLVGAGIGKVFPKLAAKATFEAGFNVRQEARSFTKGWMQWMKDARDVMKTNNMDIGHLYGKQHFDIDPSFADFMGRLHYALKTPAKRASFERAMERGTEAAMKEGLDVTDPLVQQRLGVEAYKHAERSIFQQDNILVDMWKRAINVHPTAKFIGDMTLPIVRVPTNIVIESFNHALGSIAAPTHLAYAKLFAGGVEKMTPAQADSVLRQFKQGFTGAGLMALGFYLKNDIGGYYDPKDKRKEGDVGFGEMRIFGKKVPSYLIHNPALEMLQLGATVARAAEHKVKGQEQGLGVGTAKALLGLAEETPFVREATNVEKVAEGDVQGVAGGKLRSLLVPQGVQWLAGNIDKKTPFNPQEDPIKRKPERDKGLGRGIGQEIQKGVPFARSRLQEKK